ncbi:MAG: TonB-dependent receptor [Acidobacteriaceae bacterium]|nr:TonB-dependent receptor [Acidobacteriaceae bacterium]
MNRALSIHPVLLALLLATCALLRGQIGTGTISGSVTDVSGAVVGAAALTITNTQTGVATPLVSNAQGRYTAPDLNVGRYDVQVTVQGFQTQVKQGIELTVGSNVVVDFSLKLGRVSETVKVQAEVQQVETTSAEISALVGQKQMEDLPLNGRNYQQLILLAPGVQPVTTGVQNSFYGRSSSYSIAGSRPEGQELLLDGANIQGFWNHGSGNSIIGTSLGVEAIGEFQVLTNSYSARFGGSGSVMNATTRSGTNSFHGSAYEFLRNDVFDARDFFNTVGSPQNPFRQNQFGGTVGGPILKEKMFFFVNYEGIRQLLGSTVLGTVPDQLARQGKVPCAVAQDLPCTGGLATVPVNPASQAILNLYPAAVPGARNFLGNRGNGIAQISLTGTQPANEDYVSTRWDSVFSSTNNAFVRYVFDNGSLTQPFASPLGLYPENSAGRNQYATVGDKASLSPTLVNDSRFTFTREIMRASTSYTNPALAFFAPYHANRQDGNIGVPGLSNIGPSSFTPDFEIQNIFSLDDDVVWVKGNHTIESGIEFRRIQSPLSNGFFNDQGWSFPNLESFLEGKPVSPMDPPITLIGALPGQDNSSRSFREWDLFPYVQDTWAVTRRLNLNLGMRWNFVSNPTEIHNQLCAWINPGNPSTTTCTPVKHVFPKNPSLTSIDPRLGIAWSPGNDQKTSIRAGVGVFHDPIEVRNYHTAYIFSSPYQTAVSLCVFGPPCSYPTPFAGITVPIPTIGEALEYDPGTTPFVLQYNFGIQRQIAEGTVLSVSYVGSKGYHLLVQNDLNPPVTTTVNGERSFLNSTGAYVLRTNPNLSSFPYNVPDGYSQYDSMQAYLTHNLTRNLQFQVSYTYSKCMDVGSDSYSLETANSGQQAQSDPYNLSRDHGLCDFDLRHNFVANSLYLIPYHGNRFLEGWQVGGIISAHSGSPFSVQDGFDRVGLNDVAGQPGSRPNVVGASNNPIVGQVDQWYDPSAFALQAAGTLGNVGRNTLIGPQFVDVDMSLVKITRITESASLEFRAEAFNIFNHPNFGLPNAILYTGVAANGTGIPNPSAGQITNTTGASRQLQFALKFRF